MKTSVMFFLFLQALASTVAADIVAVTCKKCASSDPNVNYTMCENMFDSVPTSHRSSLRGLGVIATQQAAASAARVQSKVRRLMASHHRHGYYNSCLETCLELYSDSVSRLNDSVGAIKAGRYGDANIWISAAVNTPSECEDGFGDKGIKSPLTKDNNDFFGLAVITLSVVAMLQGDIN